MTKGDGNFLFFDTVTLDLTEFLFVKHAFISLKYLTLDETEIFVSSQHSRSISVKKKGKKVIGLRLQMLGCRTG